MKRPLVQTLLVCTALTWK